MSQDQLVATSFTAYKLTDEEFLQGSILSDLQMKVLQNLLAQYAEEKLNLVFTPENIVGYAQLEAEKTGQIQLIQYLLDQSKACAEQMLSISTDVTEES